jgi:translation initiation factor 1A
MTKKIIKKGGYSKNQKRQSEEQEREIPFAEDGMCYGLVTKMLGNCRLNVSCMDGTDRLGHIRGTMTKRKKNFIAVNDLVLCSLRDYEDAKTDIVDKYTPKEVRRLKALGEIPNNIKTNDVIAEENEEEDIGFDFADKGESDDDDIKKKKEDIDIDAI